MLAIQQVSNGMTRIHFGFTMPYGALDTVRRPTFVEDLNHALDLVAGHFDSAWSIDHLQLDANDLLEGFTTLTYMAACHPQLMFGHAVLCQSFRNPALLAQMGATLHFLSGGRFILGIGAGWIKPNTGPTAMTFLQPTRGWSNWRRHPDHQGVVDRGAGHLRRPTLPGARCPLRATTRSDSVGHSGCLQAITPLKMM
jgi:alkanesulfonate monooxygenase SsuD/methylene tetrahydromethanopterin reductase-like flavin-dependent oxidoreductase (luciferase family)